MNAPGLGENHNVAQVNLRCSISGEDITGASGIVWIHTTDELTVYYANA